MKKKRDWQSVNRIVLLLLGLAIVAVAAVGFNGLDSASEIDQAKLVKSAVERAAIQCYALEGAYPPDIAYLEENYGLSIDYSRFFVAYQVNGSNIKPDIAVYSLDGEWEADTVDK